jgi:hypothetical protein
MILDRRWGCHTLCRPVFQYIPLFKLSLSAQEIPAIRTVRRRQFGKELQAIGQNLIELV